LTRKPRKPCSMKFLMTVLLSVCLQISSASATEPQTLPRLEKPFKAPDFNLQAEDGRHYRLSDFHGKVVVLNFWATWCPPCREEMPAMERLWQKVKDKNIVLLGINVGEDADTIFEFTGQYPVSFPLPMDSDGKVIEQYPIKGLPTTYIVNPQGMVTHRAVGSREWDQAWLVKILQGLLE
ncbi:MAG: TlpA disulfide reductase family protein, partial [Thioalkalispiraceae bacterium]